MKRFLSYLFLLASFFGKMQANEMLNYENLLQHPVSKLAKMGDYYTNTNHLDTAIGYYIVLVGKYHPDMVKQDKYLCALACNSIGQIFSDKENYSKAFNFFLKGVQISEENGFVELIAIFYKSMGNMYSAFCDWQQAVECYKTGLDYARQCKDEKTEIKLLMNLAGICCWTNLTVEARAYYDQLMKFSGRDSLIPYFKYFDKALILANEEKNDLAISCFKKSMAYANEANLESRYVCSAYGELAKLYTKMGQRDSSLHYFRINAELSEKNNLMYIFVESLKALADIYDKQGDKKQALFYKDRYLSVSDSLFNSNDFNKMKNTQFIYELDKNFDKIATLTADQKNKEGQLNIQRWALIIISVSLILFIVLCLMIYKQKRKLHYAYKDLFNRNNVILQSEKQNRNLRIEYEHKLVEERARYNIMLDSLKGQGQTINREYVANKPLSEEILSGRNNLNDSFLLITEGEKWVQAEEWGKDAKLYSVDRLTDTQKENLLRQINEIMENTKEFCDFDFSLERLAELITSNSRYVSQVINDTYNKNFRAFVNEYRIKEAQIRLMDTAHYGNYTIKAIAESVGYKSQTNFISIFKKVTGITPSIYQKIARENE